MESKDYFIFLESGAALGGYRKHQMLPLISKSVNWIFCQCHGKCISGQNFLGENQKYSQTSGFRRNMIPNHQKFPSNLFLAAIFIIIIPQNVLTADYRLNHNPQFYVLNKLETHDIVFLGTRHKQPGILNFISELITALHNSGVNCIGLEITSDQQEKIDHYMKTGTGLSAINIHPQIDCPEYRNLFNILRTLDPNKKPAPIALDLPKSKYQEPISRDEWMARSIEKILKKNPKAKMLVVVGNNHILKKLDWQDHVPNPHRSIRENLSEKRSNLRMFSIGQIIGESVYDCDFREKFGSLDGAVAVDLDERFAGWKMGITQ